MSSLTTTRQALEHFKAVDKRMAGILEASLQSRAPITLPVPKPPAEYFESVVRSIVSQQISVKAAEAVFRRVRARVVGDQGGALSPAAVLTVPEDELRACGLSGQKTRYIRRNAEIWPALETSHFSALSDEEVITELTKLYGVGRWTAEMFLMFTLARPDVFSFGDLGLMQSIYQHYKELRPHHTRKVAALVAAWSPYRTLAALALWWHKDGGPVVL